MAFLLGLVLDVPVDATPVWHVSHCTHVQGTVGFPAAAVGEFPAGTVGVRDGRERVLWSRTPVPIPTRSCFLSPYHTLKKVSFRKMRIRSCWRHRRRRKGAVGVVSRDRHSVQSYLLLRNISKSPMESEMFDDLDPLEVLDYLHPSGKAVFFRPLTPPMTEESVLSTDVNCLPMASEVVVDAVPSASTDKSKEVKIEDRKKRNRASAKESRKRQRNAVFALESTVSYLRTQVRILEEENHSLRLSVHGKSELD